MTTFEQQDELERTQDIRSVAMMAAATYASGGKPWTPRETLLIARHFEQWILAGTIPDKGD